MGCLLNEALLDDAGPTVSRRIDDYQITGEIARGGMGIVYRATQISLKRPVALKTILGGELASAEAIQRFLVEAEATAKLRHPHIVPVYDIGEFDHEHYLVMELVEGGSLKDGVGGDVKRAASIIAKVARALAFAHQHGVLHRDLKPSNILIDDLGEPRLTDFGLAKLTSQEQTLTLSQATLGSPGYMSPEQASQGEVTTASDVYGLGAVLYDLLAGRPPFSGATVVDTIRRVVDQAPSPLPAAVPRDLATICLKCLEKSPSARYPSALELAEDCERFVRGDPIKARPVTNAELFARWTKKNPRSAALLFTTLLTVIAGVSGIFWQWRKAEQAVAEQAKVVKHLRWQRLNDWLEDGESAHALAYLGAQVRERPDNWQAAMYAMSIADQNSFPMSVGPEIRPAVKLTKPALLAPSGAWVAAPAEDKSVRVWDAATSQEIARLEHESPVSALAVGSRTALAIATDDGGLALHETLSSKATRVTRSDASPVLALAFSADGSHLLARCQHRVEVHMIGAPSVTLDLPDLVGVSISASGHRVLAWTKTTGLVWDVATGRELLRVSTDQSFRGGSLSGNGQRVVLVEPPLVARSWDVDSKKELTTFSQPVASWNAAALNHAGTRVTVSGSKSQLAVYDVESGVKVSSRMGHHYSVTQMVASSDGTCTASISTDGEVRVWNGDTGRSLMSALALGEPFLATSISLSADGSALSIYIPPSAKRSETISIWHRTKVRVPLRHAIAGMSNFDICRRSPDGRYGYLGLLPQPTAYIYEIATGKPVLQKPTRGGVYDFQFSPDGQKCYAMTNNGWLYGWSFPSGQELWEPRQRPGKVRPVVINEEGTRIIAGHSDGHIRVYDTATGDVVMTLDHPGEIKSLRFAPDHSGRFVSSSTDTQAHVWDLKTGRKLQSFIGHTDTVLSTAWSPDSMLIGTACYDATVRIWGVATEQPIGPPLEHGRWMSHLEFHPSGSIIATACRDGTAHLFDVRTGKPLCEPIQQGESIETVRFTADGKALLVRDIAGFRFYDAFTGAALTQLYHEPNYNGIGIDSETTRDIMNPDGSQVFLASAMDDAALWRIEQPRSRAPEWFPELLETLAVMRVDPTGTITSVPGQQLERIKQRIAQSPSDDAYAIWARRFLGMDPSTASSSK